MRFVRREKGEMSFGQGIFITLSEIETTCFLMGHARMFVTTISKRDDYLNEKAKETVC